MKKTIRDVELNNKVVLIRVDFNVPMKNGVITNDNRIVQALPTIKELVAKGKEKCYNYYVKQRCKEKQFTRTVSYRLSTRCFGTIKLAL